MTSEDWFDLASVFRHARNKARANDVYLVLEAMADRCDDIAARKAAEEGR